MRSECAELDGLVERLRAAQLPPPARRRRIRQDASLSLRDAAAVLGVAPMTLHRWERGECSPRVLETAIRYRRFLDRIEEAVTA